MFCVLTCTCATTLLFPLAAGTAAPPASVPFVQQQKFTASDGAVNDSFGNSIALRGDTVFVGAYQDDEGGNADAGSAYVFVVEPLNAAPVVDAGPDRTSAQDAAFNLAASFTDADAEDTHTAAVDWGDGSPAEAASVVEPSEANPGAVSAAHTYLAPGTYTVTVTDGDAAAGSDVLVVTVGQCSPTNVALLAATKVRIFIPAGGARAYFSRITELEVMGFIAP